MSDLTDAALALDLDAYWPGDEAGGATTMDDAVGSLDLALNGTGAAAAILPGQTGRVPGSAGSWKCDGTTNVRLIRAVAGSSLLDYLGALSLFAWLEPTATPATTPQDTFGRANFWTYRLVAQNSGNTYSALVDYKTGDNVQSGGFGWLCVGNNGPSTIVVLPGTDTSRWVRMLINNAFIKTAGQSNRSIQTHQRGILNVPQLLAMTFDGDKTIKLSVNGNQDRRVIIPPDTIASSAQAIGMFGVGGAALSFAGYGFGMGMVGRALEDGELRSVYEAGVGVQAADPVFDRRYDSAVPALAANAVDAYCGRCTGQLAVGEGRVTDGDEVYHQGCYTTQRAKSLPPTLSSASELTDYADKMARLGHDVLLKAIRRSSAYKTLYFDGKQFQPYSLGAAGGTYRQMMQPAGFAAILGRYGRAGRDHWTWEYARRCMETMISWVYGAEDLVHPDWTYTLTPAPGAPAALAEGALRSPLDNSGGEGDWLIRVMAEIILAGRNVYPPATIARWTEALVKVAEFSWSGSWYNSNQLPNALYYINGNYAMRLPLMFYLTHLVTGDDKWLERMRFSRDFGRAPYGLTLNWRGIWAAGTSYSSNQTNGAFGNGPQAVIYSGAAYKCILSISGSGSNPAPPADPTHWQRLASSSLVIPSPNKWAEVSAGRWNTQLSTNGAKTFGYGEAIVEIGSDDDWDDYRGFFCEYQAGNGGGPIGDPLRGQPYYDGDYSYVQLSEVCYLWQVMELHDGEDEQYWLRRANMLLNQIGSYPVGGLSNPTATPFEGQTTTLLNQDKTSGASGGYSTRHNIASEPYRVAFLPISIVRGMRPDLDDRLAPQVFGAVSMDSFVHDAMDPLSIIPQGVATLQGFGNSLLIASPEWPGFIA